MSKVRADDLLFLLELARTGRLVDAANRLGVEHTTVSRRIGALEKAVGRRLVHRAANRWLLTDDGERLLTQAETVESAMHEAAELRVSGRGGSLGGTVRAAAPDGFGCTVVAQALAELQQAHPRLEIELTTATRRFDVTYKDYDLSITLQQLTSRRLFVQHLTDYMMELYATSHYLEEHAPITGRDDLASHTFVWYVESLLGVPELDVFEDYVVARRPILRSPNIYAQLSFVLANAGIGLLPRFLAREHPELIPVLPERVSVRQTMWLVVRRESMNLARVQAAIKHLKARVATLQHELTGTLSSAKTE